MAQDAMVMDRLVESGNQLIEAIRNLGLEIAVAFWAKPTDEEMWFLYLASSTVDVAGAAAAYRIVHGAMDDRPELGIDLFDVRVISDKDSMAIAAAAEIRPKGQNGDSAGTSPRRLKRMSNYGTRYAGLSLGGVNIDGAYIYPANPPVVTA